jgi:class I fructose-bisphosphate aldolase
VYEEKKIAIGTLPERVKHVMQCCFDGRRIVVFSGGAAKGEDSVLDDARAIHAGGGNGSIIGRNCFQRPREDALKLLDQLIEIYKGK